MKKRLNKDKALHRPTQAASLQEFSDANGVPKGVVENVCDCLGYGKERDRQSIRRIFKHVRDGDSSQGERALCAVMLALVSPNPIQITIRSDAEIRVEAKMIWREDVGPLPVNEQVRSAVRRPEYRSENRRGKGVEPWIQFVCSRRSRNRFRTPGPSKIARLGSGGSGGD